MANERNIMICVTRQKACERLIKMGKQMVKSHAGAKLYVVHVAKNGENFLGNPDEGEALDYLFQVSKEAGAEMTVLRSNHVVDTLVDFAKRNNVSIVVMGESPGYRDNDDRNIIQEMERRLPDLEFKVVPQG
ncbi:K+-sensing histidine kinase KdpD [Caldicoprobacter guelmensis]|uniref:universal stress protein n=1 Tax=Caldicoprobacter guelmensis TaxID=1170224 RepID=UPI0019567B54|nr:universal stress protein [Caldicoprobacter guelmensis]MBM7582547.1 K+-sensing histidine kinase KdpD [Caldicoprobacter guelmensis]